MGYTSAIVKGVSWIGAIRVSIRLLTLLRTAITARILNPSQLGIFTIATLVLALIDVLTETGINIVLVQKKEGVDNYINTAWVVSIVRGIFMATVMLLTAPFIASFFNSPLAYNILLFSSLIPFIKGFINPSIVKFQKDLTFHKEFMYRTSIFVVEVLVSILFVVLLRSEYGFIIGMIFSAIFEVGLSFAMVSPRPKFNFEVPILKDILHRGKWITLTGIFTYLYQHLDDIVVGRVLGTFSLGLYDYAYRISLSPMTDIADATGKVTLPVYVRMAEDKKRLLKAYLKSLGGIVALTLPMSLVLLMFPQFVIEVLLGPQWVSAVDVLRVLAVFGFIRAFSVASTTIFLSIKRQDLVSLTSLVGLIGLAVTIFPFISLFGLVGAAWAATVGSLVTLPVIYFFIYRIFLKTN